MAWQADSIQALVFTAPFGAQNDAADLWSEIFPDDKPDGYQRNPTSPNLQSTASGERHGFNINLTSQVGQAAIAINPVFRQLPGMTSPGDTPPRIERLPDATNLAIQSAKKIAARLPVLLRAALILDLAQTIPSPLTAEMLSDFVPGLPLPAGAIEPNFQFNSQTDFQVSPPIRINRICGWSTGQVGFVAGNMPGVQIGGSVVMTNYIGLRIDVNTVPQQVLQGHNIEAIFDFLNSQALGIADRQLDHFG